MAAKDFILNTAFDYSPILAEGSTLVTDGSTAVLYGNMPAGADYHVFQTVSNSTYGNGIKRAKAWVDANGNLKANDFNSTTYYWRVYGY